MDSRRAVGLTAAEVHARRDQFGENRLPIDAGVPGWRLFLRQFASPLVYIVLIAAFISLLLGEIGDVAIIMVVVIADVILGFVQERQAQNTYLALRGLLKPTATVIRDGRRIDVEVWELVPGDVLVLAAGDRVPADATITAATRLALDEAILTGESEPVAKPTGATVFMGATVVTGRGEAVVTATGMRTEMGRLAGLLAETAEGETPLQRQLDSAGTGYKDIVEQVRQHLAARYVHDASLSLVDIALMLGFAEQSTFQRAFRRWFNTTPGEYRRTRKACPP